jgi:hypothetical protein
LRWRQPDAYSYGNTHSHGDSYSYSYSYSDSDTNGNGNGYGYGNSYLNREPHGHCDGYCYRCAEVYADSEAATHPSSAPISSSFSWLDSETREQSSRVSVCRRNGRNTLSA